MTTLTVTSRGQVTLRKDLLEHMGVEQGQHIEVSKLPGGRIEVKAARPAGDIGGFIGLLAGKTTKIASLDEIDAAASAGWAGRR